MKIRNVDLRWLGHSSFLIKTEEGKVIYIDPYNISGGEPADIVLITHPHYDHCSLEDIDKIVKEGTIVVCPADCQSKIARLDKRIELKIVEAGQTIDLGIRVGTVPAYNIDKEFHRKEERWVGYVIKINETTIYHAGDTDLIPEMEKLNGKVDIALLPVGGQFTMNAEEAAEAASVIKPDVAVPMHYNSIVGSSADAEEFVRLCEENGIKAQILGKE